MDLSLIQLRNILTNYASSAALNAARAYEYRQPYWELDADVPSHILDVELGLLIKAADPEGEVFVVQIKTIPEEFLAMWASDFTDKWTATPQYATVHAAGDWLNCYEYRLRVLSERSERQLMLDAVSHEQTRKWNMAKKICARLPVPPDNIMAPLLAQATEESLREFIAHFEQALNIPIYEPPLPTTNAEAGPRLPEPQGEVLEGESEATSEGGCDIEEASGADRDASSGTESCV